MNRLKHILQHIWASIAAFVHRHGHDLRNPRFFTLLIVPHDSTDVRKLRVGTHMFKIAVVASVVCWIAALVMFFHYFSLRSRVAGLLQVEKLAVKQKIELDTLNSRMQFIEVQLSRMQTLDSKIRSMLNLGETPAQGTPNAGGTNRGDVELDVLARKTVAVEQEMRNRELSLAQLATRIEDQRSLYAATPSIWPARGLLSSEFGWRKDPVVSSAEYHEGIDILLSHGAAVSATGEGIVITAGWDEGYGKCVVIDHGYGIVTRYAHLSAVAVREGAHITKGQLVGRAGSTGKSTGTHLHYEVRIDGVPVNPMKYILS